MGKPVKNAIVFPLHGSEATLIKISPKKAELRIIEKIKNALDEEGRETFAKAIADCRECRFEKVCRKELEERGDLSLISGISSAEIKLNQSRGIFTINQFSHTYRPRRRPEDAKPKFYASLKALAIRESKVHIVEKPEMATGKVELFLDVEGLPEIDFYYLIGVIIRTPQGTKSFSLWADDKTEERKIWMEFLSLLKEFEPETIFHFGNYERTFFERMRKRYRLSAEESIVYETARSRLINVVMLIYGRIYFPTFSNGLKDIGKFLGAAWSDDISGLVSIALRNTWEISADQDIRAQLMSYNMDDCRALGMVVDFVRRVSEAKNKFGIVDGKEITDADDVRIGSKYKWGSNSFFIPELEMINKCAYFDYQSTRICFGDRKKRREWKIFDRRGKQKRKRYKVNQERVFQAPHDCPECGSDRTWKHSEQIKTIVDLKFLDGGVRRWIVRLRGHRRRCERCRHGYLSNEYPAWGSTYGQNLIAFMIYLNIGLKMSFGEITDYFRSVFGIEINPTVLSRMKQTAASYYETMTKGILRSIKKGSLVHVDETNARINGKACYVWVFATLTEVVYLFAESRKGGLLHAHLKNFKGVLVSDFFAAYDSVPCEQQKCLVHLIRDLNDDLFKNQLNSEFKGFVSNFAKLMKDIVETIDRRGLQARYLKKHKKEVKAFFRSLKDMEFKSEITLQYKKRFLKNKGKLFTFLDHDNVPWNNNYAENAIKTFAEFRHKFNPYFQKNGLREYLILLSVRHTCKLRGVDFLQFLLSGRKSMPASVNPKLKGKNQGSIGQMSR